MDTITSPAAQMPTKEEMMAELRQLVEAGVATITDDRSQTDIPSPEWVEDPSLLALDAEDEVMREFPGFALIARGVVEGQDKPVLRLARV